MDERLAERLGAYVDLLRRWNSKLNLTRLVRDDAGLSRLAIEPLAAVPYLPPQGWLVDIGSGAGRFVVAAARAGASAVGIARQEPLVVRARDNARMAGVASRATFLHADALTLPSVVSRATVVTMFLTPGGLDVLVPWLEGVLRRGTRVVSHTWPVPGWRPSRVALVEDAGGRTWPIYLYRVPAADAYAARAHRGS